MKYITAEKFLYKWQRKLVFLKPVFRDNKMMMHLVRKKCLLIQGS